MRIFSVCVFFRVRFFPVRFFPVRFFPVRFFPVRFFPRTDLYYLFSNQIVNCIFLMFLEKEY